MQVIRPLEVRYRLRREYGQGLAKARESARAWAAAVRREERIVVCFRIGIVAVPAAVIAGVITAVFVYQERLYCADPTSTSDPDCNGMRLLLGSVAVAVLTMTFLFVGIGWLLYHLEYSFAGYSVARDLVVLGILPLILFGVHLGTIEAMSGWLGTGGALLAWLPVIVAWWWRLDVFAYLTTGSAAGAVLGAVVGREGVGYLLGYAGLMVFAAAITVAHVVRRRSSSGQT